MTHTFTEKIINLTPHEVSFPNRSPSFTSEPSGLVARCNEFTYVKKTFAGIPLAVTNYGDVENLHDPKENTLYIVSMLVRLASPDRKDIASPGELIRDEQGQIIGANNLIINV